MTNRFFLDPVHAADIAGVAQNDAQRISTAKAKTNNFPDREQVKKLAIAGVDVIYDWAHANFAFETAQTEIEILEAELEFPDIDPAEVRRFVLQQKEWG